MMTNNETWKGHELTPWWPHKSLPGRPGRYEVMLKSWPFPTFAEYSEITGWRNNDGPVTNLKFWRGLVNAPGKKVNK